MSDSPSSTPLTDQAIKRLRVLATGNGVEPDSITLIQTDEQTYALEGIMTLVPFCDVENKQYAGPASGGDVKILPNAEALRSEVAKRRQELQKRTDWIAEVQQELHESQGQGWGLDGAKVLLPERAAVLAASSPCSQCHGSRLITCPQCQGAGFISCIQCRGQRQEICYNCAGSGQNPNNRSEPCPICRGIRYVPCRLCQATGQTACPTCGGRRGTPCPACRGAGQMTEEARLSFGATTHFRLKLDAVPSGLRRGLDRLGIANLPKGHADIEVVTPKPEADEHIDEEDHPPEEKPPESMLHYIAHLPFADMRVDFGGRKASIGVFGKRGVPLDVPAFLDEPLKPWREKLGIAAQGHDTIEEAIKARALRDALALELQGKGNAKEFRRLYPVGLSMAVIEEIVRNTRNAVRRSTLLMRAGVAVLCGLLSAGFFAGCFFTSLPAQLAQGPKWFGYALDFAPPLLAAGMGWAALTAAMRLVLRKRFPNLPVAIKQTAGKTGIAMTAGILIIWLVILVLSPAKPAWLPFLH